MHILCSFVHRCVRSFSFGSFPPIRVPALSCMSACPPLIIVVSPFTTTINSKTLRRLISCKFCVCRSRSVRYLAPPKGASTRSKSRGQAGALHCINILGRVSRRSFLAAKVLGNKERASESERGPATRTYCTTSSTGPFAISKQVLRVGSSHAADRTDDWRRQRGV